MSKSSGGGSGVGFLGLLAIVFITLKLIGYINWSWWWVLAPIWIPWSIALVVFLLVFIAAFNGSFRSGLRNGFRRKWYE